jgi:hypothetical protein
MPTLIKSNWPRIAQRHTEKMLDGSKTCFIRCQRLMEKGDIFEVFGAQFRITKVEEGPLEETCQHLWPEAGYDNYQDLMETWEALQKDYIPTQNVWIHYFEKV